MLSWLPSIPYPPEGEGRWSPVTSTIDWCEENYYATVYSAEIVNTLTNFMFMYLAVKGMRNCLKNGHDQVFFIAYIGYLLVSIGSFLFHATLKYSFQLVDELNMIYTTCLMCYATFSYGRTKNARIWLASILVAISAFVTVYYHFLQDPTFHQAVYAILTIIVFFRSVYVMEVNLRPSRRSPERNAMNPRLQGGGAAAKIKEDDRDAEILAQMWTLIIWGLSIFLGGFLLWHLDREYCSQVRVMRHEIGMPWGFMLEGHGWWHLMTGLGAYMYIVWTTWLRHCVNYRQPEYKLVWDNVLTGPEIVRCEGPIGVSHNDRAANRSAKKTI